jgi:hypothetical protein
MILPLFRLSLVHLIVTAASAQDCTAEGICDKHQRCGAWREDGECFKNADYMMKECPASCADENYPTKNNKVCKNHHVRCPVWAGLGECDENPTNMKRYCPLACGVCVVPGAVDVDDPSCVDSHEQCSFWSKRGECSANPGYMHVNCAKSCGTCEILKKKDDQKRNLEVGVTKLTDEELGIVSLSVDFGDKQTVSGSESYQVLEVLRSTIEYFKTDVVHLPNQIQDKW